MKIRNPSDARPRGASPFVDIAAVEAWDAWFRWRRRGRLIDVSIDDTWTRVADALAVVETSRGALFARDLVEAGVGFSLLVDERILASAGTDAPQWSDEAPVAVLNAAAFVSSRFLPAARFDHDGFARVAALAVRALDNAQAIASAKTGGSDIAIGVVGVADALAMLRLRYDSPLGRAEAQAMARALFEGTAAESTRLAAERGARRAAFDGDRERRILDALPAELRSDLDRFGLRHLRTTSIAPQPRLALLANNVADALDPLGAGGESRTIATVESTRSIATPGYAMALAREAAATNPLPMPALETIDMIPTSAQIALRGAMQPWIDRPIAYPLAACGDADGRSRLRDRMLANAHGIGEPAPLAAGAS